MKKSIVLFCFIFLHNAMYSQSIYEVLNQLVVEKNENKRIDIIYDYFLYTLEKDPESGIQNAQKILEASRNNKDIYGEAMALFMTGANYRQIGDNIKGLEYNLKAKVKAEQTHNFKLIAIIQNALGNIYKERSENTRAISLYREAEQAAIQSKSYKLHSFILSNLGQIYLITNKTDSALYYSQRAYEEFIKIENNNYISSILTQLGGIQEKIGNDPIAISYYRQAINEAKKSNITRNYFWAYNSIAKYFKSINKIDSSLYYAKKAITAVDGTPLNALRLEPAKMLLEMYKHKNNDSAIKYLDIYSKVNDSLFSAKAIQQTQLMTIDEDIRQKELSEEREKAKKNRKENIQYALIGVGIITLFVLYLLLSQSIISNPKLIEFFGVIALLILFEFLNLLLHPFLERITHHSPLLMLMALVCIAALLVPLHHKVEKWAISKLVEKNKKVRLEAAQKTLKKLQQETAS